MPCKHLAPHRDHVGLAFAHELVAGLGLDPPDGDDREPRAPLDGVEDGLGLFAGDEMEIARTREQGGGGPGLRG